MPQSKERGRVWERMRHAVWAGVIAIAVSFSTILMLADQLTWITQSRVADHAASGDIVYVGSNEDLTDSTIPGRRAQLAETLDILRERGADRVYVDLAFSEQSTPEADAQLNAALRAFDGRAYLVRNLVTGLNGELQLNRSVGAVADGVPAVGNMRWQNYLGYAWDMPYVVSHRDEDMPSLPASIASVTSPNERFPVDYGFEMASIPVYRFSDLHPTRGPLGTRQDVHADVAGKVVVIGNTGIVGGASANIPGHMNVPITLVGIYAAETLKAGYIRVGSGLLVLMIMLTALTVISLIPVRQVRYAGYTLISLALLAAVVLTARAGIRISIADTLALLVIYAGFRGRAKWRSALRLVDPATGLPTFAALEADKEVIETIPTIVVARIHRFEEVRKTLPGDLHAEYLLRIIGRLKAAKKDATIYVGPGHLIAWTIPEKEPALIRDHLEGLRALFASPLLVGDNQVDVGITFGADITPSPNVERRVAAAVEAAEKTTETYEPIAIAEMASDEDLIWNISLQARIDAALANGEIYLIYQPKILVQTGELASVEALVRWRDPVRGLIPPDHFIRQCENAGRMAHLTRHVLTEACRAGIAFEERGLHLPIAVNISATLVHEPAIVSMVREVLAETGFDPRRLTLEITETYRISNFDTASVILEELSSLGPKISMDDFGVGAASLEALQRLPFGELKIDRTFTSAIKDDPKSAAIVSNVLNLGKDLRIIVVAEGVEDAATLTILRDSGCLVAQGFAISRPISFDEILRFQRLAPQDRLKNMV